jgi:hypothetical protein
MYCITNNVLYVCEVKAIVLTNVTSKRQKENKMESTRKRKSEKLPTDVKKSLVKFVESQPTQLDAADKIGISRGNLMAITVRGTCHPDTATKIREALSIN